MNAYTDLKERHSREVNDLPLYFAFSNEQFEEALQKMGLTLKDTDQLRSLGMAGGFYHKDNSEKIHGTFIRHEKERKEAIESDTKGDGYIYEMFLYELNNHEYGYTWDTSSTLNALGLTLDEIEKSKPLKFGFEKAVKHIKADNDC
jgi:hypothetical protein